MSAPESQVAETALQLFHERNTHIALLIEALERMEEECDNREEDLFDLSCPCCDGALPMPHSFGCRLRNALHKAGVR